MVSGFLIPWDHFLNQFPDILKIFGTWRGPQIVPHPEVF